jgi:uncharacterized protein (DUF4415 family)
MNKNTTSSKSATDWERLDAMDDNDIDLSDCPEIPAEAFARAIVRSGLPESKKKQVTMRLDSDVLDWFKSQGKGYQTKINSILKAYKNAHISQ